MRFLAGLSVALIACAAPATAQTTGSISLMSDYVARGTSQTYGAPSASLYLEHDFKDGTYVSGFVGYVDFDNADIKRSYGSDGTFAETDAFVGHRGKVGKFNYDVMLLSINYLGTKKTPGYNPSGNWNMVELHGWLSRTYGKTTLTADTGVTPNYFNNYGKSIWVQGTVSQQVNPKLALSAALGRQQFFEPSSTAFPAHLSNYNTWNLGATYNATPHLAVDLRYYDTGTNCDMGSLYKPRVVLALKRSF